MEYSRLAEVLKALLETSSKRLEAKVTVVSELTVDFFVRVVGEDVLEFLCLETTEELKEVLEVAEEILTGFLVLVV